MEDDTCILRGKSKHGEAGLRNKRQRPFGWTEAPQRSKNQLNPEQPKETHPGPEKGGVEGCAMRLLEKDCIFEDEFEAPV